MVNSLYNHKEISIFIDKLIISKAVSTFIRDPMNKQNMEKKNEFLIILLTNISQKHRQIKSINMPKNTPKNYMEICFNISIYLYY